MASLDMDSSNLQTLEEQQIDILREKLEDQKTELRSWLTQLKPKMWRDVPVIAKNKQARVQEDRNVPRREEQQEEFPQVQKENEELKKHIEDLNQSLANLMNEKYSSSCQLNAEYYTRNFVEYFSEKDKILNSDLSEKSKTTWMPIQGEKSLFQITSWKNDKVPDLVEELRGAIREKKAESREKGLLSQKLRSETTEKNRMITENKFMPHNLESEMKAKQKISKELDYERREKGKISKELDYERREKGKIVLESQATSIGLAEEMQKRQQLTEELKKKSKEYQTGKKNAEFTLAMERQKHQQIIQELQSGKKNAEFGLAMEKQTAEKLAQDVCKMSEELQTQQRSFENVMFEQKQKLQEVTQQKEIVEFISTTSSLVDLATSVAGVVSLLL